MGLSLWCDSINTRVGSYSQVHIERRKMIEAAIKYLENEAENIELKEELKNWISDETSDTEIKYNNISDKPSKLLIKNNLEGLHYFVNHSDNEGYLTPDESVQILNTLNKIINYLEYNYINEESRLDKIDDGIDNKVKKHYLYKILIYSIKNKKNIEYH